MKDAFGTPQSLLALGGTSGIALATARRLLARRTRTIWLAGRPTPALDSAAAQLREEAAASGVEVTVRTAAFDALAPQTHEEVLGKVFAEGDIDMVLLTFGVPDGPDGPGVPDGPGGQKAEESDPMAAVRAAQTNYTGAVSSGLVCARALRTQGHGSLVVLSSGACGRARRANFRYGSSKAGLDAFARGLGDALRGTGVHVMVVRPGSVRTGVTEGRAPAPFATTSEAVAEAIAHGLLRRSRTVWVPARRSAVGCVPRLLPRAVFRRLPG